MCFVINKYRTNNEGILYMGIQSESIQSAPKIAHLRNLYEASVTAALFMIIIITFVRSYIILLLKSNIYDGKIAHFPPPNPLLRLAEAARPRCRQNEKSMKRREKPRAAISCDTMTIMRDGVLEL